MATAAAEVDAGATTMSRYRVEPHLFVILGGTGDLTRRKLLPAMRRLASLDVLGDRRALLAVARDTEFDDDGFRGWAKGALEAAGMSEDEVRRLDEARLYYQPMPTGEADDYEALANRIQEIEGAHDLPQNRAFYLALPPRTFSSAIEGLASAGLNESAGWTRLVVEKPFGRDLESARELNREIHRHFTEDQVYRIDHYLGKETVQNLLVFRFANPIFESLWNRDRIESVQITVAEDIGIESRAGYYDQSGALRDMVQNHVAQLVALVGMEVPATFRADAVRYEKIKLLGAVAPISIEDVVFGQYARGTAGGEAVPGYLEEDGVDPESNTETFVALELALDTWRWQGVPFYVRTGKRLPRRLTQIAVTFQAPPVCLFESMGVCQTNPNVLYLTLQPDEGFALNVDVKVPGEPFELSTLPLDFFYKQVFGAIPDAYQTLLLDVLTGDQTLFVHADEAEASWELFGPLLEAERRVHLYRAGAWGPDAADELLAKRGHAWLEPVEHPDRSI
ncbi:MAG: glucose-6-phosphate dehydrogenase [Gemmatimonadetes bacterium]|nr:glucose-6-phosphate dehydrogenase [Gemmatimonadota bacterium]